jgi:lipoprotein-releasing system ATP-binding protein
MAETPILRLTGVSKNYDSVAVLRNVTLDIQRGESVAIVGPSGSGKSTLLNIIGTLDRPSAGQVLLDGQDLSGFGDLKLAEVRNRQIGFVFQSHHLLPHCDVLENVLVPTLVNKTDRTRRARDLLDRVGLGHRLTHRPGQLSGGERQRVAVVRALINEPKLLLADEPTGSLDRASAGELGQLLVDLNREQSLTLIVVTHALDLAQRMGRQFEIRQGELVA